MSIEENTLKTILFVVAFMVIVRKRLTNYNYGMKNLS